MPSCSTTAPLSTINHLFSIFWYIGNAFSRNFPMSSLDDINVRIMVLILFNLPTLNLIQYFFLPVITCTHTKIYFLVVMLIEYIASFSIFPTLSILNGTIVISVFPLSPCSSPWYVWKQMGS